MSFLKRKLVLAYFCFVLSVSAQDWSYEGNTGPRFWKGECKGKSQSPINIPRVNNTEAEEEPFQFTNYDRTPDKGSLLNPGSTIKYSVENKLPEDNAMVNGGGLPGDYEFAQFHLHWGANDRIGSEHTLNQVSYPVELHLVHFKKEYGNDLGRAIAGGKGAYDTLAVLGIMFKLQNNDNPNLNPILDAISSVQNAQDKVQVTLFPLQDLLPKDLTQFYRYNGSLTTPGCNEIVVWTVFKDTINISVKQMASLRTLYRRSPVTRNNFRPVQPLNGRTILEVKTESSAPQLTYPNLFIVLASTIVFNKFF